MWNSPRLIFVDLVARTAFKAFSGMWSQGQIGCTCIKLHVSLINWASQLPFERGCKKNKRYT